MIFDIHTTDAFGGDLEAVVLKEVKFGEAWDLLDLMREADFNFCYMCCFGGYENAVIFPQ